jgi:starch-binding outer membrane protein, SusD/RagB family
MKKILPSLWFFLFFTSFLSCKKFVEIGPPPTELVSQNVFINDASATGAMLGTYSAMMASIGFASGDAYSITQDAGLSADEFINYNTDPNQEAFYRNNLTASNGTVVNNLWNEGYKYIYSSNAVLEGLNSSTGITDSTKKQLEGEAKFLRAFCHFYLVNLFGDVPLVLTTDYKTNSVASRTAASTVYAQIILDLKDAQALLSPDFRFSNGERIRPTQWAATALLARVYLYQQDWADAETQATGVISQAGLFSLDSDLNSVFLKNSSEAIWQLMPVLAGYNTNEGNKFILTEAPIYVTLTSQLANGFEIGDKRRNHWVDSIQTNGQTYYFAYKYKVKAASDLTEYSMVLRLAEQWLIRAEARAEQGNVSGAEDDLNVIRTRAGLPNTTANDKASLLTAILHERQVELFSEWGHRWLDLKRTRLADQVLGSVKAPGWQSTDTLYPIPKLDITNDPNLTQNPGY